MFFPSLSTPPILCVWRAGLLGTSMTQILFLLVINLSPTLHQQLPELIQNEKQLKHVTRIIKINKCTHYFYVLQRIMMLMCIFLNLPLEP